MLTGGEPLRHRNLWVLCGRLQSLGIRITLVTTGLLIDRHAPDIAPRWTRS
jgi:organic radical activating enzyme